MPKKKVLLFGDPRLRKRALIVNDPTTNQVEKICNDLNATLNSLQRIHKKGGGLAAPQLGYNQRIIYIKARGSRVFMINPKIVSQSRKRFDVWDFCFSSHALFLARIKRHKKIVVEYSDTRGEKYTSVFEDYWAELLQHEIDHLNGILFIDHIKNPRNIMMMEEWDRQFVYKQGK